MHCHCNLCSVLWWQSFVLSQKACHSCVNKAKGIERGVWGSKDVESNSRRPSVMLHLRAKREVWRKNCLTVIHPISRCSGWRYHCPSLSALVLEITVSKVEKLLAWVSWVTVLFKYTIVQFAYVLCINSTFVYMMCFGSACINTCTDKIVKAAAIFLQIWYVKKKSNILAWSNDGDKHEMKATKHSYFRSPISHWILGLYKQNKSIWIFICQDLAVLTSVERNFVWAA